MQLCRYNRDCHGAAGAPSIPPTAPPALARCRSTSTGQPSLAGILDFDSVHLDLRATDVACARRSSTDGVVHGYLRKASLTDVELATLDDSSLPVPRFRGGRVGQGGVLCRGATLTGSASSIGIVVM